MASEVDKKGVIKAMTFAILLAFLGIAILGWQYRRIEKEQIPALEEKIEQKSVELVLEKFMRSRIEKNEIEAMFYLTEGAMEQKNKGEFSLLDNFASFQVISSEKIDEDSYRYAVKIFENGGLNSFVEVVSLIKILDQYYIDSVQIAG